MPDLQKMLRTPSCKKQIIFTCFRRAAKKRLPVSSHIERPLAIGPQACLDGGYKITNSDTFKPLLPSRVPRRCLKPSSFCLSSNSWKVLQATRFSRCVSFSTGYMPNMKYCKVVIFLVYLEAVLALAYEMSLPCTPWDPAW